MLAVQNSDELIYIWSFEPLEKSMTLKDIFPGLSRTLSFNFEDFPGPGILKKKNPGLSKRRGNPNCRSGLS